MAVCEGRTVDDNKVLFPSADSIQAGLVRSFAVCTLCGHKQYSRHRMLLRAQGENKEGKAS